MNKIILIVLLVLLFVCVLYFFSGWGKDTREKIWIALDRDYLYMNDDSIITGWIWTEADDVVMGKKDDGELFKVNHAQINQLKRDFLLKQLRQIL